MSRKNKIIVSIVGISIISLALIGLTYGYYLTRIQGNTNNKSISISTANLELTYSDNSDVITGTNIVPGTTLGTKTFTVTNNGDNNVDSYSVGLVNVINDFTRLDDIKYTVTCTSSVTDKKCNGISESTFPNENSYIIENQINKDEVQTYEITVEYKEMNVDQSDDMGKTLEAKIDIFDTKSLTIQGSVTNYSENDYVVIHSKEQTSEIIDGKYKFIGIEPDTHKITIKNRKTTATKQTTLNVSKGTPNASGSNITYNDEKNVADADIKITGSTVTIDANKISDGIIYINSIVLKNNNTNISNNSTLELKIDKSLEINAEVNSDSTEKLTWTSSNKDVVSIDTNDTTSILKGLKVGTSTITVKSKNVTKSFIVKVTDSKISFTIDNVSYSVEEGTTWEEWVYSEGNEYTIFNTGDNPCEYYLYLKSTITQSGLVVTFKGLDVSGKSNCESEVIYAQNYVTNSMSIKVAPT